MKRHILTIAIAVITLAGSSAAYAAENNNKTSTPQEKIIKDFSKQFAQAPSVTNTGNGFLATSVVDGRKVDVAYNKKGNRKYAVVRYSFNNLDKNIVDIVKNEYNKYFITSMEKVEQKGFEPVYIVHLVDANSIKTIKITGENSELVQSLQRV